MRTRLWRWVVLLCVLAAGAQAQEQEPLEPDRAFRLSVRMAAPDVLEVRYRIAEGYYMYRDKFAFEVQPGTLRLGEASFPPGQVKEDPFLGRTEIYSGELSIRIPVSGHAERGQLVVTSQGCADIIGICYPPHKQVREFKPVTGARGR